MSCLFRLSDRRAWPHTYRVGLGDLVTRRYGQFRKLRKYVSPFRRNGEAPDANWHQPQISSQASLAVKPRPIRSISALRSFS